MEDKPLEENVLKSQGAAMTAQVQIIRAKTGKVEDYTLQFTPLPDEQQPKEQAP